MSSAVYLFMNRYTDITPALYSEREAEESSLIGDSSGNVPAVSSWIIAMDPLQCMCGQGALGRSRMEETQESQGEVHSWEER